VTELTRNQARQFRAVLRKAAPAGAGRLPRPALLLRAGPEGLRLCASYPEVAVEYRLPGPRPEETIALSSEALDACAGRQDSPVEVEPVDDGGVQLRWDDDGLPQVKDHDVIELDKLPPWPAEPTRSRRKSRVS
jgi:hypothetical protein